MATRGARMTARRLQWRKTTLFRLLHPIPLDPHHAATTSTADRSKGRHIPQVQTDGLEISLTQMTRLQKQPAKPTALPPSHDFLGNFSDIGSHECMGPIFLGPWAVIPLFCS
ncbi:protein of unknown function [Magnetospira sp. QH-2]|nr:protein of unknown function [Magnetospira sp. QH-2]